MIMYSWEIYIAGETGQMGLDLRIVDVRSLFTITHVAWEGKSGAVSQTRDGP